MNWFDVVRFAVVHVMLCTIFRYACNLPSCMLCCKQLCRYLLNRASQKAHRHPASVVDDICGMMQDPIDLEMFVDVLFACVLVCACAQEVCVSACVHASDRAVICVLLSGCVSLANVYVSEKRAEN
jgi:hypothetical protein